MPCWGFKRLFSSKFLYSLALEVTSHFTDEKTEAQKPACGLLADSGAAQSLHYSDSRFNTVNHGEVVGSFPSWQLGHNEG